MVFISREMVIRKVSDWWMMYSDKIGFGEKEMQAPRSGEE